MDLYFLSNPWFKTSNYIRVYNGQIESNDWSMGTTVWEVEKSVAFTYFVLLRKLFPFELYDVVRYIYPYILFETPYYSYDKIYRVDGYKISLYQYQKYPSQRDSKPEDQNARDFGTSEMIEGLGISADGKFYLKYF